jgi:hypothetical protein
VRIILTDRKAVNRRDRRVRRENVKISSLRSVCSVVNSVKFSQQAQLPFFQRQQLLFDWQAPAVAGELAVGPDHAVARNDDRNRIGSIRQADRAARVWTADSPRQFTVRDRLAMEDLQQFVPDLPLKGRAFGGEVNVEGLEFSSKIRAKLANRITQCGRVFMTVIPQRSLMRLSLKPDLLQPALASDQQQLPKGRFAIRIERGFLHK